VYELNNLPRLAVLAGPAGIGKTRFLLGNFAHLLRESKNPFLRDVLYLLPSAEHRERIIDLMLRKEMAGFFGERVTTFNRLMQELLKSGDFSLLTDAERRFLLNEIVPVEGGEYFASVSALPGFLEGISELIGELKESMIGLGSFCGKLKELEKARPGIQSKYQGLAQIYQAYEARLEALGVRDHRDGLFLLRENAKSKEDSFPRFRHLFVDGFFDFSRSQFEFLGWLAARSERVILALTLDLSDNRKSLFEIPLETLRELEKLGFQTVDLSGRKNHRALSKPVAHVEKRIFSEGERMESAEGFLIMEATGIRGEVEMIAREVRRIVRTERLNYSDVALILRRIGPYERILRAVFKEFQVPFEMHEREKLQEAPLARTLASFFKILLNDWKREDLFNFLKSSYVEKDFTEICSLEIRAFSLGILAARERWLGELGGALIEKINAFQERFEKAHVVNDWISLTKEVIHSFGLDRIPSVYEESARRDFAALKCIHGLLEEIRHTSVAWQASRLNFPTFAQELLGLIEVDLFSLHDRDKNRVQVYDISLARQKEYRVVFLAGLLEKHFPVQIREDPILSDEERGVIGLAERLPRQALERYFFYLGLTRAREKVILSYPRFDLEGHEALPSFYVDEVKKLFEKPVTERKYPVSQSLPRLEDAVEEREIEAQLVRRLFDKEKNSSKRDRAFTLALYNRLLERPSFQSLLPKLLFDSVARIESEAVRNSFSPKREVFSPTGLEAYGRCPFRYFASHVLHLEEKEEGIDPRQVGVLLHQVLEDYWNRRVRDQDETLGDLETARAYVPRRLHELMQKEPLFGERAYRIRLKIAQMEEWLCGMVEKEIEEGHPLPPLRPRYFEMKLGFPPKNDYLKLYDALKEDLKLRLKIDRIDIDPSGKYALVIDYKTGSSFKRQALEFGTALQLPLYLLAIQQHLKLKPLGGEIYQINEATSKGFYAKEALDETGAKPSSRAVFSREEFEKTLERATHFSKKFAKGILAAEIPVKPRDCDDRCPFPSVCRIEKWRLPFITREIQEEDKKSGLG